MSDTAQQRWNERYLPDEFAADSKADPLVATHEKACFHRWLPAAILKPRQSFRGMMILQLNKLLSRRLDVLMTQPEAE
jgi:hypothetical protein